MYRARIRREKPPKKGEIRLVRAGRLTVQGRDVLRLLKVIAETWSGNKPHREFRLLWVFTSTKAYKKNNKKKLTEYKDKG